LIDEIYDFIVHLYIQQRNPQVLHKAQEWLSEHLSKTTLDDALITYLKEFPPEAIYQKQVTPDVYLEGETDGIPNRQRVLEELLIVWLDNMNSAASPFIELFDDAELEKGTSYLQLVYLLREFFETQPRFGDEDQNLVDMSRSLALKYQCR
jgi:hypothetical protein